MDVIDKTDSKFEGVPRYVELRKKAIVNQLLKTPT